jgi:hypothetical protein
MPKDSEVRARIDSDSKKQWKKYCQAYRDQKDTEMDESKLLRKALVEFMQKYPVEFPLRPKEKRG